MRIKPAKIKIDKLGEAIRLFLVMSEQAGPLPWPEVAKNLAAASFVAGALWAASHKDQKSVVDQCKLAQELFNRIPEGK